LEAEGAAHFAGIASIGWIAERLLSVHALVDTLVDGVAHHARWIAGGLLLLSVVCWMYPANGVYGNFFSRFERDQA